MTGNSSALVIPLVVAILIVLSIVSMWILIPAPTGKRKQKFDESTTGTRNLPGLHPLRNGEFVGHDTATLAKFVQARVGGSLGTRGVRVWPFAFSPPLKANLYSPFLCKSWWLRSATPAFRKNVAGPFSALLLRRLPKAHAWSTTVLVDELHTSGFDAGQNEASLH